MLVHLRHPYLSLVLNIVFWCAHRIIGRAIPHQVPPLSSAP